MDMENTVIEILANILDKKSDEIRSLNTDEPLGQHGLESIRFIRFIVEMEEKFDIEISDSDLDMDKFADLGKIYAMLKKYLHEDKINYDSVIKCIITDCDNCLWGGIAADDGSENIIINGIYIKYQKMLTEAYNKGVLLALCSKNDEKTVDGLFASRSDMIIKLEYIITQRINWKEKHKNIEDIVSELNIGLDSILYIDDSERELFWINQQLPDVKTILFNEKNIDEIERVISNISANLTERTQLYKQEKKREASKSLYNNITEYYASLKTALTFKNADKGDIDRLVELSYRTNQFNLNATRYSEEDIDKILENNGYEIITLTADDIFGTLGLCAFCVIRYEDKVALIEGFMMSCRVFGRYFEDIFLAQVKKAALKKSCQRLIGLYTPTEKNKRFADFYSSLELNNNGNIPLEYFSEVTWID